MADDSSSDEDIDVQNGYDGEPDIFLPGGSGSDTTDSPAEIVQDSDGEECDAINFDPSLPAQHQYLGEEMDEFSGRTYHEPGSHVTLPLLMRPDLVLVPGQTLPLHLSTGNHNQLLAAIGTTVEIFSMKEENEAGICTLRIKATGRQRFKIKELRRQVDGVLMATVHVLPEVTLPSHPEGSLLSCYHKFGCQATTHGQLDKISTGKNWLGKTKCKKVAISLSSWPRWVYQQYNPYVLMEFIKKELKSWKFSFWVAANMPLDDDLRLQVLGIDCPTQRLRRELEIVRKCGAFCCSDMSLDGPLGAYVNPNGCVHETLTFYRAKSFRLRGRHTTENSWFPGYAWTIAECAQCGNHLGWRFTAVKRGLSPSKFWGLTRKALKPTLTYEEGNDHRKACSPPTPS
ncbi:Protein cereblon [Acropora cervicornis]|uniref:Protein cereblon n=1 Tax=Acropora cervicornis TaxID=6130 RepID=A0AAD9V6V7_ACRCE|nr:Protein cereblon [Acropora cervicornis]